MHNLLFINACIRDESRTKMLADAVLSKWDGEITEVDLNKEDIKPLTKDELAKRMKFQELNDFSDEIFKYGKQVMEADAIVIAAPYWDLSFPAILKTYIEHITISGLTFDMDDSGNMKSYCKAKKLVYVTTVGSKNANMTYGADYIREYAREFLGINNVVVFKAEGLDLVSEKEALQIVGNELAKIEKFSFTAAKRGEDNRKDIIVSDNLTKVYGKFKANDHVSIHVKEGSIYGLIGRNGAGKSTLMRMMLGITPIDEGTLSLFGKTGKEMIMSRKDIGFMIEVPAFIDYMTAYQNLKYRAELIGLKNADAAIKEAFEKVGMSNKMNDKVKGFSLGQRQLLGMASAIMGNPPLLILDEPTNGLDPIKIVEVRNMLLEMNRQGTTILISSHILGEMDKLCSCFGFILDGKLIREVTEEEMEEEALNLEEFFVEMAKGGQHE